MTVTATLRLEGEVSIYRAAELKQTVLAALAQTRALEIDLGAVSELDGAGLQILLLAKRQAVAEQRTLRLVAHSPAVLDVFELLNLAPYFGDPLLMSSAAGHS